MRLLMCSLAFLLAGLAAANDNKPAPAKEHEVTGNVTLDGKAIAGATVRFSPVDPKMEGARSIAVETSDDGTYRATGFLTAAYKVTIVKLDPAPKADPPKDSPPPKNVLPPKFADPNTTPLRVEITAGKQTVDLVLKSK